MKFAGNSLLDRVYVAQAVGAAAILRRSAEIQVQVSHALVMQWILSH